MTTAETSNSSYHQLIDNDSLNEQQALLFKAVLSNPGSNARELGDITGLEINAVTGRLNELVNDFQVIDIDAYKRRDEHTNRLTQCYIPGKPKSSIKKKDFLTEVELSKLFKLMGKANDFQKQKIKERVDSW